MKSQSMAVWLLVASATGIYCALPAQAQDVSIEANQKVDLEAANAYAKAYDIDVEQIMQLRRSRMGWGEIEIALSMAQNVSVEGRGGNKLNVQQSLDLVVDRRRSSGGWGKCARSFDLQLGQCVSGKFSPPEKGVNLPKDCEKQISVEVAQSFNVERKVVDSRRGDDCSYAEIVLELSIAQSVSIQRGGAEADINQSIKLVVERREKGASLEECARDLNVEVEVAQNVSVDVNRPAVSPDTKAPTMDKKVEANQEVDIEKHRADTDKRGATPATPAVRAEPGEPGDGAKPAIPAVPATPPDKPDAPDAPEAPETPDTPAIPSQPTTP